jgi:hypothetical protein
MNYEDFLQSKLISSAPSGFMVDRSELPPNLYEYQSDLTQWALRRGKAALFTMTGTGKTPMQSAWCDAVSQYDGHGAVLLLAPLAVSKQTVKQMGEKFNIDIRPCRHSGDIGPGINITNYEMLHHFSPDGLVGLALDESSILKSFNGKTRTMITDFTQTIPFRLACTATPAPNDYMELGTHAEFLGVMSYTEMLATFFVHDGGDTSKWRLKGHAEDKFYEWLASWGVFLTKPSDLGYSDEGFDLPELRTVQHVVEPDHYGDCYGDFLPGFTPTALTLQERQMVRRTSVGNRCIEAARLVAESDKPFMVWCDLNTESETLKRMIPGSVEVKGSDKPEHKEWAMMEFAEGNIECLISKPSICGFGMNWQVCHETAFVGLSDSFEAIFQATKRFHRHGQLHPVTRHFIISSAEGPVLKNVERKETDFLKMISNMVKHTRKITIENVKSLHREQDAYNANQPIVVPGWLVGGQCG